MSGAESLIFGRFGVQKKAGEKLRFHYPISTNLSAHLTVAYLNAGYNADAISVGVHTTLTKGVTLVAGYIGNIGKNMKKHNASLSVGYVF